MTQNEIKTLQDKASEIYDYFSSRAGAYVKSGREVFELNQTNFDDVFVEAQVADGYWWKFEWWLTDSPLVRDDKFFSIEKVAAEFRERYAGFFRRE